MCFFITELDITIMKAQIVSKLTNIRHKSKLILLDFSEELNFFTYILLIWSFHKIEKPTVQLCNHAIPQVSKILLVILKGNKALALPQATCPCTPSMSKRMTYDFVSRKWQFFFKTRVLSLNFKKYLLWFLAIGNILYIESFYAVCCEICDGTQWHLQRWNFKPWPRAIQSMT